MENNNLILNKHSLCLLFEALFHHIIQPSGSSRWRLKVHSEKVENALAHIKKSMQSSDNLINLTENNY